MKGLEEYIKKHGRHFTEELAYNIVGQKWTAEKIKEAAQKKVYYNVTGSTDGDLVYLTNFRGKCYPLTKAVNWTLSLIGNYLLSEVPFNSWVEIIAERDNFDFTPYI